MATIISTRYLLDALEAEGFPIPANCRTARVVMGVNSAFVIEYECFVTVENLARLGRAFERLSVLRPPADATPADASG